MRKLDIAIIKPKGCPLTEMRQGLPDPNCWQCPFFCGIHAIKETGTYWIMCGVEKKNDTPAWRQ